jgi:dTDP-4-dehydrorhamnose 3,5-epimerase
VEIKETGIKDLVLLTPKIFKDDRGYFYESFSEKVLKNLGLDYNFVQDNQSFSSYGALRGLHFQNSPHAQAKLVRVIEGEVLDVAVDLRPQSATFKKHFAVKLSGENNLQMLIPRGFAHGFVVLSKTAIFAYKCDNYYNKESDGGVRYDDSELNISWILDKKDLIVSDKDKSLPLLKDINLV